MACINTSSHDTWIKYHWGDISKDAMWKCYRSMPGLTRQKKAVHSFMGPQIQTRFGFLGYCCEWRRFFQSEKLNFIHNTSLGSNPATAISPPDCFRSQSNKSRGRPRTKDHVVLVQYADGEAVQGPCCGPYTAASPAYCTVKYSQVFYSSRSQISQTWWPTLCVS